MKTHYAYIEHQANESYNETEWSGVICGMEVHTNDLQYTDNWECVDCKKCLKRMDIHRHELKEAMEHNIRDMAGFVEFMEKENAHERH